LKRTTVLIQFQPPAMCRAANQQARLPRATSSLEVAACSKKTFKFSEVKSKSNGIKLQQGEFRFSARKECQSDEKS